MSVGSAESLDNRVAGRLAGRLAGHVQSLSLPWAAQVISWLDLVDLCRELDGALDATGAPSEEGLAMHESVVNLAIGCGGWLVHQIRLNGVDLSPCGQTLETLDASLELLRIMHRSRHSVFSSAEIEAVRQRVFNAGA
jgi:hypothetical protein